MKVTQLGERPNPYLPALHLFNIANGFWYVRDENGMEGEDKDLKDVYEYYYDLPNVTDTQLSYLIENKRYKQRKSDGFALIKEFSGKLRIDRIRAGGDRTSTIHIQTLLQQTIRHLEVGWWISAKESLEEIGTDAIFTIDLKNELLTLITSYIDANY